MTWLDKLHLALNPGYAVRNTLSNMFTEMTLDPLGLTYKGRQLSQAIDEGEITTEEALAQAMPFQWWYSNLTETRKVTEVIQKSGETMPPIKCEYCGSNNDNPLECVKCGAPLPLVEREDAATRWAGRLFPELDSFPFVPRSHTQLGLQSWRL